MSVGAPVKRGFSRFCKNRAGQGNKKKRFFSGPNWHENQSEKSLKIHGCDFSRTKDSLGNLPFFLSPSRPSGEISELRMTTVHPDPNPLSMIPFAGLLVTIALAPVLFREAWHRHYAKI